MEELYFCRHGETEDLKNKIRSTPNTKLTDKGWGEAYQAGELLVACGIKPDLILCSELPRTFQTARPIAQRLNYPLSCIVQEPLLNECDWGKATGMLDTEWIKHWPGGIETVPGVETTPLLQQRAVRTVDWVRSLQARIILIVGHGTFSRSMARVFEGRPYTDEFKGESGRFKNGEVARFYPQPTMTLKIGGR